MDDTEEEFNLKLIQKFLDSERIKKDKNLYSMVKENKKDEWFYFSLSYLKSSSELVNLVKLNKDNILLLPAMFNFRHGIELTLKYFDKRLGDTFKPNHNIRSLYDSIKLKLVNPSNLIFNEIIELINKDSSEKINPKQFGEIINDKMEELEGIVNRYYFQIPFTNILKSDGFYIEDCDNQLFRYPEAEKITLHFNMLSVNKIEVEDINIIGRDIDKLIEVVTIFNHLLKRKVK